MLIRIIHATVLKQTSHHLQQTRGLLTFQHIKKPPAFKNAPQLVEVMSDQPTHDGKVTELAALHQQLQKKGVISLFAKNDVLKQPLENPKILTSEQSVIGLVQQQYKNKKT